MIHVTNLHFGIGSQDILRDVRMHLEPGSRQACYFFSLMRNSVILEKNLFQRRGCHENPDRG